MENNNQETFVCNGTAYTKETFCEAFNIAESDFEEVYNMAKSKGLIKETLKPKSAFDRFMDELNLHSMANDVKSEETWEEQARREERTENKCKYEKVKFSFSNAYEASAFVDMVLESGIMPENVSTTADNKVVLADITQAEYNKFALWYQTKKATNSAVRGIGKTTTTAANVGQYAAENIVAPIVKSGIKALGMLTKTLVKTTVKTGSSILSTAVETASETCNDIKADPDVIKAADNANRAKNSITNGVGGIAFGKGIEIG